MKKNGAGWASCVKEGSKQYLQGLWISFYLQVSAMFTQTYFYDEQWYGSVSQIFSSNCFLAMVFHYSQRNPN